MSPSTIQSGISKPRIFDKRSVFAIYPQRKQARLQKQSMLNTLATHGAKGQATVRILLLFPESQNQQNK